METKPFVANTTSTQQRKTHLNKVDIVAVITILVFHVGNGQSEHV